MGVFFVGLHVTLFSDALVWLLGARLPGSPDPLTAARVQAAAIVGVTGLAVLAGLPGALRVPPVRRRVVPLARWPAGLDGFRIVQISDIHIGPILGSRFAARLTERVNALEPDLVAVTGDLVDGREVHLRDEVAPFGDLSAAHGVYYVTGNHDFYSGADDWVARTEALGMRPLRNARTEIRVGDEVFDLAGVDDFRGDWRRGSTHDLDRALAGRVAERPVVLLAHDPSTFHQAAGKVDLQLSGHTHGGQIWPFRWMVRMAVPFVAGFYRHAGSTLYVSRGTGFWGPPLRLFAPAEITELVLMRATEEA
jgi:predicted MPP superfamily phosphohydrolase